MEIFTVVGFFFATMFRSVQADAPRQMVLEIDGVEKIVSVKPYHKPLNVVRHNGDLGGGFYIDQWGDVQAK